MGKKWRLMRRSSGETSAARRARMCGFGQETAKAGFRGDAAAAAAAPLRTSRANTAAGSDAT
eukprot:scaffold536_cov250-Pinguiococcus_pyrenoidosus.AAC.10